MTHVGWTTGQWGGGVESNMEEAKNRRGESVGELLGSRAGAGAFCPLCFFGTVADKDGRARDVSAAVWGRGRGGDRGRAMWSGGERREEVKARGKEELCDESVSMLKGRCTVR